MSGASPIAVEAGAQNIEYHPLEEYDELTQHEARKTAQDVLSAAHDPALGLDRSVCARDFLAEIVEALREFDDLIHPLRPSDFIERKFGES